MGIFKFLQTIVRGEGVDRSPTVNGRYRVFSEWNNQTVPGNGFERWLLAFEIDCLCEFQNSLNGYFPNGFEVIQEEFNEEGSRFAGYCITETQEAHDWLVNFLVGCYAAEELYRRKQESREQANRNLRNAG